MAKLIIKLINSVAGVINQDREVSESREYCRDIWNVSPLTPEESEG